MGAPTSSGSLVVSAASRTFQMPTVAVGTNAALVTNGPCSLYGWQGTNVSGVEYVLKLYDLNRAPVVGTDIPFLRVRLATQLPFPAFNVSRLIFSQGMAMAITQNAADADTLGVVTANDIDSLCIYFG